MFFAEKTGRRFFETRREKVLLRKRGSYNNDEHANCHKQNCVSVLSVAIFFLPRIREGVFLKQGGKMFLLRKNWFATISRTSINTNQTVPLCFL